MSMRLAWADGWLVTLPAALPLSHAACWTDIIDIFANTIPSDACVRAGLWSIRSGQLSFALTRKRFSFLIGYVVGQRSVLPTTP